MTIETQTGTATYQGDGSNKTFSIPYRVDSLTHLRVYVTDRSVAPPTVTAVSSSDYTAEGDFTQGAGTLKYPKDGSGDSPIASTKWLTIERIVPLVQDTNFSSVTSYFKVDAEAMGDKLVQMIQQVNDKVSRAVVVPVGSGITVDEYVTSIEESALRAEEAATRAEDAVEGVPAVPFKEVFGIGGTSPFAINQTHNGYLAVATVGAGGLVVNLPQMSTLTFPYQVAIKRKSGSATLTVNAYAGDNINGSSSLTISSNGETVMFIADDDTLAGTWTNVTCGSFGAGTITNEMLGLDIVEADNLADDSVMLNHLGAEVETMLSAIPFRDVQLISADKTATQDNNGMLFNVTASGTINITLPTITSVTSPYWLAVRRESGSGTVNVLRSSSNTINGATSYVFTATVGNAVIFVADFTGGTAGNWSTILCGTDASVGDGSVTTAKIADGAITAVKLATDSVSTVKIADSAVTTAKIADSGVTTVKIADSNVTTGKIADSAISTAKIADGSVTTGKIATGNISTATIADSAVTNAKLNSSSVTATKISTGAVETDKIADGAVTTAKIANSAVGLTQLSTTVNSYLSCIVTGDVQTVSSSSTLTGSQKGYIINLTASSALTLTLPLISGETAPLMYIIRRNSGTSTVTITANAANTINGGSAGGSITLNTTVGSSIMIVADFSGGTAGGWFTLVMNA